MLVIIIIYKYSDYFIINHTIQKQFKEIAIVYIGEVVGVVSQLGRVVKAIDLKSIGVTRVGSNPAADDVSGHSSDGRAIDCSRSISVIRISIGHWFESGCPEYCVHLNN